MEFAFNASALVAGATIERRKAIYTMPSLGSVMLNPAGGEGRTAVTGYYSEELKLDEAETKVTGREFLEGRERRFVTFTSVLLRGVSIFSRVNIREMGATIISTRGMEEEEDHEFDIDLFYEGVTVDGKPRKIVIDEDAKKMKRYGELDKFLRARNRNAAEFERHVKGKKPWRVPLVAHIDDMVSPATIFVPRLGTFRFGELLVKPGMRRINLIHAFFGDDRGGKETPAPRAMRRGAPAPPEDVNEGPESNSAAPPTSGEMIVGSGEGNGTPIGP